MIGVTVVIIVEREGIWREIVQPVYQTVLITAAEGQEVIVTQAATLKAIQEVVAVHNLETIQVMKTEG